MFGKGAKRKLDEEDDEGLEGQALAPPVAPGAAGGPGPRWPEGPSKVSYTLQRQTIFNISLMKLMYSHRSPPAEPRLERRVLINNMLRRIQEELKQEGALRPPLLLLPPSPPPDDPMDESFREVPPTSAAAMGPATPAPAMPTAPVTPAPAAQPSAQQQPPALPPSLAPPPSAPPHTATPARPPPTSPAPMEACLTPASLLEDNDAAFCTLALPTLPLSPPPTPPNCQPASPLLPTRGPPASSHAAGFFPPAQASLVPGPLVATAKTAAAANTTTTSPAAPASLPQPPPPLPLRDCRTTGPRAEVAVVSPAAAADAAAPVSAGSDAAAPASHPYTPAPPSPSGFLSDLALDDILFADIDTSMYDFDTCTTAGAVSAKLSPTVMADDLLKSLASPYTVAPAPQVSANQPFKIDLTELDHIMEVLVGS